MTRLGETSIVNCPACNFGTRVHQYLSVNAFWQVRWSDGYTSGWPSSEVPLRRCYRCEHVYLLDDAWIRSMDHKEEPQVHGWRWMSRLLRGRRSAQVNSDFDIEPEGAGRALDTDGYILALEALADGTRHRECVLRTYLWWHFNHARRRKGNPPDNISRRMRELVEPANQVALLRLLEAQHNLSEDVQLRRAELLRQLGDFHAAAACLDTVVNPGRAGQVAVLRERINARDILPCVLVASPEMANELDLL